MKPLDHKYLIERKRGVVTIRSIEPLTGHETFLEPKPDFDRGCFDMGYVGSKCRRVAFAILLDFLGSDAIAFRLEAAFEFDHVARWMAPAPRSTARPSRDGWRDISR